VFLHFEQQPPGLILVPTMVFNFCIIELALARKTGLSSPFTPQPLIAKVPLLRTRIVVVGLVGHL